MDSVLQSASSVQLSMKGKNVPVLQAMNQSPAQSMLNSVFPPTGALPLPQLSLLHIQIALHHRRFLKFTFEGVISVQSPAIWAGFGSLHVQKVHKCGVCPLGFAF